MLKIDQHIDNEYSKQFVKDFFADNNLPKYIFGRNTFAKSIADLVDVDGFIDDFTQEKEYLGKSIVSIYNIPSDALVVTSLVGKPLLAGKRVHQFQFKTLDYFSFYRYASIKPQDIPFWDGFKEDFEQNIAKYNNIYNLLNDKVSKNQFYNLINFRLSYDLDYMRGFSDIEDKQYFESFIPYSSNESFIDVGSFDGYTSKEFMRINPNYKSVHIFEPEEKNMIVCKKNLEKYNNIFFYQMGLSNKAQILKFDFAGSASRISDIGETEIKVESLDKLDVKDITFIKMDIEGAEEEAILGAKETIKKYQPKIAISVYHKANDFWRIPELILSICSDYTLYLRHYTEGISETVMFFIPK